MRWTGQEIAVLLTKYEKVSWTELKGLLPARSKRSIVSKATDLGLRREDFSTRKGSYFIYAKCPTHGRVLKKDLKWRKNKNGVKKPHCSKEFCNREVRMLPRSSKLRGKYREVNKDDGRSA